MHTIWHPFNSIEAARAALRILTGRLTLRVRTPYPVSEGSPVHVKFQIGHGPIHQADGSVEAGGSTPTVRFEGEPAAIVRGAIDRPASTRRFERFRCWLPVTLWTGSERALHGYACDIAVGGSQVTLLSRGLSVGADVFARFTPHRQPVPARVTWSNGRAAAGLAFLDDCRALLFVRRLVTDVALATGDDRRS